jgi:hypothetical protein
LRVDWRRGGSVFHFRFLPMTIFLSRFLRQWYGGMADDSNRFLWLFSLALCVFFFSLHSQNVRQLHNSRLATTHKPSAQSSFFYGK